jgi:ferritin-like protein
VSTDRLGDVSETAATADPGAASAAGRTRAEALRAALAGGALVGAGALVGGWTGPDTTAGEASRSQDARILNFLLVLEELQLALYTAALHGHALSGDLLTFARTAQPQEREHVALLRARLGRSARPAPRFEVAHVAQDARRFRASAIQVEETTAAAYIGQGASLTRDAMLDAARIVAVEARHAAWVRDIAGVEPAPRPADPGRSSEQVLADLRRGGFLS